MADSPTESRTPDIIPSPESLKKAESKVEVLTGNEVLEIESCENDEAPPAVTAVQTAGNGILLWHVAWL